ncbi:hypothetical protein CPB86DRAFT_812987 [Serendipita vermifera]|nr:hypothetical protein CPB86DRAFT_812987 [Serendipita vermifera]
MNPNNQFSHANHVFNYNQVNFVDDNTIWVPVGPPQNMNHNYQGQLPHHSYGHTIHQPLALPTVPSHCQPSQSYCSHPAMPFNQPFDEFPFLYPSTSSQQYPSTSSGSSIGLDNHMTPGGFSVPALQYDSLFDGASAAGSEDGKMPREKKFKCAVCSKMFTHRSRAEACAAKDKGERPFACDGKCGIPDW